jgi:GNAT superfamily N-acetyltransferase
MAATDAPAIERLSMQDVTAGLRLSREAGWNQTADDWTRFLTRGEVFGRRDASGRLIATAALLPSPPVTWISMVLVSADHRRRGHASDLMGLCIAEARRRGLDAWLDATPAGASVYAGIGFEKTAFGIVRLRREGEKPGPRDGRPPGTGDLAALLAADLAAMGFDRSGLMARLATRVGSRLYRKGDAMALVRDGDRARHIGPVFARDEQTAIDLIDESLVCERETLLIDAGAACPTLIAHLHRRGFESERPFTRMRAAHAHDISFARQLMAVAGPEFG